MNKLKSLLLSLYKRGRYNPTLLNIITVGSIAVVIKGAGFYKEMYVASAFGLSELIDTFIIAALLPGFISSVFLDNFNSVFIPNYISEQKTSNNIGAFQMTSLTVTVGTALFFMLVCYLFTEVYLGALYPGHTTHYYHLIITQFHYLLPCILFWGLSSLLGGLLNIYDEFTYVSISPLLTTLAILGCLIFFREQFQERVLAIGTLIGSILQFLFLLIVAVRMKIFDLKKPDFKSANAIMMFRQIPAKVSSGLLAGVNPMIDQYFSAQLIIGSIAAISYGIKIPAFVIGIIGIALGSVLLPYFSKSAVEDRDVAFKKLQEILKYLIYASVAITIIVILLSSPIISLLFERGAFTDADTYKVSRVQQMYALHIPSYIAGVVMIKFLVSINRNNFMVLTSLISLILNFILNYVLIKYLEVYGLALATSLVSIINSIILYIYICHINKKNVQHTHANLQ
ncbi:MAG: murein biosynthesis integral membrane protein MurJ [Aquaticitalea sp.]